VKDAQFFSIINNYEEIYSIDLKHLQNWI